MHIIEKTIEVIRPVSTVYDQWTRFQEFPQFMKGIKEVRVLDDRNLRWTAVIGGQEKVWDAEIVEQVPDELVSWRSTSGAENSGKLTFISLTPTKTRIILLLTYEPKGFLENLGDNLGWVTTRVTDDLNNFKKFVESGVTHEADDRLATTASSTDR